MATQKIRVVAVDTPPIQYWTPAWRRLAREPELMERKRSAVRVFRGGEFSWTSYAQRTLKLCGELLSS